MKLEDIVEILKNSPEKAVPELLEDVRKQYGEVPYIRKISLKYLSRKQFMITLS